MLNVNINYPYPVIREYIEDYKNTIFTGKLTVQLESEGYVIHPSFDIENNEIRELIEKNFLTYAVEVQCVSTWFRRLYRVDNNQEIHLNSMEIHERVEITPCIIANRDIPEFVNDDFEEEYQGMSFEINIGDIIGIGSRRTFDALYQNDIIKNGTSIVSIARSDVKKEITSDFTGNIIQITLPKDQYSDYMDCGYNKIKYKLYISF